MIDISIKPSYSMEGLNRILADYRDVRGATDWKVLTKKGGQLAREMYFQLRAIRPEKGSIRAKALELLSQGKGIKIRAKIRQAVLVAREAVLSGKAKRRGTTNLGQMLVRREIATRESGRGFLAWSSRYPQTLPKEKEAVSRYGARLSTARVTVGADLSSAYVFWSGAGTDQAVSAAAGLEKPKALAAVSKAVAAVESDTAKYVQEEYARMVGELMGRAGGGSHG